MLVDDPDRVENLHRMVSVETWKDLRDCAEVAVDELALTTVVVDRARARAPSDEELKVRDAECVLDVDGEEAEAKGILCRWAQTALLGPRLRLARGPRKELAKLRLRGSARSASGAAAHALRHPVVRRSQLCTPLGIPVQPSREVDLNLSWQNFGAPNLLPRSDRLRPALRCGGVAPPTAGRSRLRTRRRPLSRPRAVLRLGVRYRLDWPLEITGVFAQVAEEAEMGSSDSKLSPESVEGKFSEVKVQEVCWLGSRPNDLKLGFALDPNTLALPEVDYLLSGPLRHNAAETKRP